MTEMNPMTPGRRIWLPGLALMVVLAPTQAGIQDPVILTHRPGITETAEVSRHPKLRLGLGELLEMRTVLGAASAGAFARMRNIWLRGDNVRIVAVANAAPSSLLADAAAFVLKTRIENLGGEVEIRHGNLVQAYVPLSSLAILAEDSMVKTIRPPLKPRRWEVRSEGVLRTGANFWSDLTPYRTSTQAKICILDAGFAGYQGLLGTELPSSVTAKSFRADGDIFADVDHGTACAEIVHDMAPNAKLWLVNFETDVEEASAVDWIIGQGIQVISYSLGWTNAGAGDGTGPICADVEWAASKGIVWASAAGNAATDHWEGYFADADSDGWLDFPGGDRYLEFHVPAYTDVDVALNWKDWGTWNGYDYTGTDQDYDLYLYIWQNNAWQLVDKSADVQNGGQWPVEEMFGWYSTRDTKWAVSIKRSRGAKAVRLELFTFGNDTPLESYVSTHSLTIPADAVSAIAVGATDWEDDSYHYYSAQGPTHDGRVKPDLMGPSGVSTATYGHWNFYGTSASAPHVAGACGLLRGGTPYAVKQIRALLEKRAVHLGSPGKNNVFGFGRLNVKK